MRVDEAGNDGQLGKVDDVRTGRNDDVGADLLDPFTFDQDDLIGCRGAGLRIHQPAGAHGGDLLRTGRRPATLSLHSHSHSRGKHGRDQDTLEHLKHSLRVGGNGGDGGNG